MMQWQRAGVVVLAAALGLSTGCARTYVVTKKRLDGLELQKTTKARVLKAFGEPDRVEPRESGGETLVYVQRKRRFLEGGIWGGALMGLYWGLAGLAVGGPAGLVVVPPAMLLGAGVGAAGGTLLVKDIAALRVHLDSRDVVETYEIIPTKP